MNNMAAEEVVTCLTCSNYVERQISKPLSVYQKVFSVCKRYLHCSITDDALTDEWNPVIQQKEIPICSDCFNGALELGKLADNLEELQKKLSDLLLIFSLQILNRRSQAFADGGPQPNFYRNSIEVDVSKLSHHFNQIESFTPDEPEDSDLFITSVTAQSPASHNDDESVISDYLFAEYDGDEDDGNLFVCVPVERNEEGYEENSDIQELEIEEVYENTVVKPSQSEDIKVRSEKVKFKNEVKSIVVPVINERRKRKAFITPRQNFPDDDNDDIFRTDNVKREDSKKNNVLPQRQKSTTRAIVSSLGKIEILASPKVAMSLEMKKKRSRIIKSNVKRYMKTEPSGLHRCVVCNYATPNRNYLHVHMRGHTGEKPYKCHTCSKSFRQGAHLRVHMFTHSKIKHYKCPMCKKRYSNSSSLRGHIKRHSGKKEYKCTICSYETSESGNLKRHIVTHSDYRGYQCASCGKLYKSRIAVKNHYKSLHPEIQFTKECIIDPDGCEEEDYC